MTEPKESRVNNEPIASDDPGQSPSDVNKDSSAAAPVEMTTEERAYPRDSDDEED